MHRTTYFLTLAVPTLLTIALLAPGCSEACEEDDCEPQLSLQLAGAAFAQPGAYEVDAVLDGGQSITCTITVSDASGGQQHCNSNTVELNTNVCAKRGACLDSVVFHGQTPKRVALTIKRDGQTISSQSLSPSYKEFDDGCGQTCAQATVNLTVH